MNEVPKLTKEQAAIIGVFTGVACGPFSDVHEKAEKLMGEPIWSHEFADEQLWKKLKDLAKPEFIAICHEGE